jgi:SlyX protein
VPDKDERRLVEIETKLAHQEYLVTELNDALSDQQSRISALELRCENLLERIRTLGESGSSGSDIDERPPHY